MAFQENPSNKSWDTAEKGLYSTSKVSFITERPSLNLYRFYHEYGKWEYEVTEKSSMEVEILPAIIY